MPPEQRVISTKAKIPAPPGRGAAPVIPTAEPAAAAGGKKKRTLLVVLVLVLLGGAAAWYFLMGPGAGPAEPVAEPVPEPGSVQVVEAISLNLAGGHYLRIGLGLQLTDEVTEEVDTARALDIAIELFSGRTVDEVASAEGRAVLKQELTTRLAEAYEGEVMGVYFTDYVTQ